MGDKIELIPALCSLVVFKLERAMSLHTSTSEKPVLLLAVLAAQLLKLRNIFGQRVLCSCETLKMN